MSLVLTILIGFTTVMGAIVTNPESSKPQLTIELTKDNYLEPLIPYLIIVDGKFQLELPTNVNIIANPPDFTNALSHIDNWNMMINTSVGSDEFKIKVNDWYNFDNVSKSILFEKYSICFLQNYLTNNIIQPSSQYIGHIEIPMYKQFSDKKDALKFARDNYGNIFELIEKNNEFEITEENILKIINENAVEPVDEVSFGNLSKKDIFEEISDLISNNLYYFDDESQKVKIDFENLTCEQVTNLSNNLSDDIKAKYYMEINQLILFYDFYENSSQNDIIKLKISEKNSNLRLDPMSNTIDINEILILTPNYDSLNQGISDYNVKSVANSNAINYANKYAKNPVDKSKYKYFRADCTNFASQILEAGGIKQIKYSSEYSGWWHTVSKRYILGIPIYDHKYSISFINADKFAKYMGVGLRIKNFEFFSSTIQRGDFIAFDDGSDGDYEHIAYVTEVNRSKGTYGSKKYYNFKVAQHTTNYHDWVNSSINNWEYLEEKGFTYARIRR